MHWWNVLDKLKIVSYYRHATFIVEVYSRVAMCCSIEGRTNQEIVASVVGHCEACFMPYLQ